MCYEYCLTFARYSFDVAGDAALTEPEYNNEPHNHLPPKRVRLDQDVQSRIDEMASHHVARSLIHKVFVVCSVCCAVLCCIEFV